MEKTRFSDNQIDNILKQTEQGVPIAELCRENNVAQSVVAINTGSTNRRIAIRSYRLSLEPAFIHINDGIALLLKIITFILIYYSLYRTGLWMF